MRRRIRILHGHEEVPPDFVVVSDDNQVAVKDGDRNRGLSILEGFNESGADCNFRVEGTSDNTTVSAWIHIPPQAPPPHFVIRGPEEVELLRIQSLSNDEEPPPQEGERRRIMVRVEDGVAYLRLDGEEVQIRSSDWVLIDGSLEHLRAILVVE